MCADIPNKKEKSIEKEDKKVPYLGLISGEKTNESPLDPMILVFMTL